MSALWRYSLAEAIPDGLRRLREGLQGGDAIQTLTAYLDLLHQADFSDLRVQQEIHPVLPRLLEYLQDSRTPPNVAESALQILALVQERSRVDPALEHLYWVRILYCLGRYVSPDKALPLDFYRLHRVVPGPASTDLLRAYFLAPMNPDPMRGLALLAWSGSRYSRSESNSSSLGPSLLGLVEDPSRGRFSRRLALHLNFTLLQNTPLSAREQDRVERDFLSLLGESPVPDPAWRESAEAFASILEYNPLGDRAFHRYFSYLDRLLSQGGLTAPEMRSILSAHDEMEGFFERKQGIQGSVSPLETYVSRSHLEILYRLLSSPGDSELRRVALDHYSTQVYRFLEEAAPLHMPNLALAELRRGMRWMRGILANPFSDVENIEIAADFITGKLAYLPVEERRRLEGWTRDMLNDPRLGDWIRVNLYHIAKSLTRHLPALLEIEAKLIDILQRNSTPRATRRAIELYTALLGEGVPLRRLGEVLDLLITRAEGTVEDEGSTLAMVQFFDLAIRRHFHRSGDTDRILRLCETLLQDARLSDFMRHWAMTVCVAILSQIPLDPRVMTFRRILEVLEQRDPSEDIRLTSHWGLEQPD